MGYICVMFGFLVVFVVVGGLLQNVIDVISNVLGWVMFVIALVLIVVGVVILVGWRMLVLMFKIVVGGCLGMFWLMFLFGVLYVVVNDFMVVLFWWVSWVFSEFGV